MTAFQTHPGSLYIRDKKFLLFQKVCKQAKTFSVSFLYSSYHMEGGSNLRKAFFPGFFFKCFIDIFVFFKFIMLGKAEKFRYILGNIHRIRTVNSNTGLSHLRKMFIEDFCVFPFLIGSKSKDCLNNPKAFLFCLGSSHSIAVSGLAFSSKGPHKIFFGRTVFK